MKKKKDITKLIKKKIIDKKGRLTTVYVKLNKNLKKEIFLTKLAKIFNIDIKDKDKIAQIEYKRQDIKNKYNIPEKTWVAYFYDYFRDKHNFDNIIKKDPGSGIIRVQNKSDKSVKKYDKNILNILHAIYYNIELKGGNYANDTSNDRQSQIPRIGGKIIERVEGVDNKTTGDEHTQDRRGSDTGIPGALGKRLAARKIVKRKLSEETKNKIAVAMVGNKNAEGAHDVKVVKGAKEKKELYRKYTKTKGEYTGDELAKEYSFKYDLLDIEILKYIKDNKVAVEEIKDKQLLQKLKENNKIMYYNGDYLWIYNYLMNNIYELEEQLEKDKSKIDEEQYKRQKKILEMYKPKTKNIEDVVLSPISPFTNYMLKDGKTLRQKYLQWLEKTAQDINYGRAPKIDLEGVGWVDVIGYVVGKQVRKPIMYGRSSKKLTEEDKQKMEFIRYKRREVAQKLFLRFIKLLNDEEKAELTRAYNKIYNGYAEIDYSKIPFTIDGLSKEFKGHKLVLNETQLRGISFLTTKGSGMLAYGVGAGKTATAIISIMKAMQMGRCKKPLIVVPKSTYWKWVGEIKDLYPNIKLNTFGNMRNVDLSQISDGSVTIITYEGLQVLDITDKTHYEVTYDVSETMAYDKIKDKTKAQKYYIEDLGFDHITIDEAHNFRNVFGQAKLEEGTKLETNEFSQLSGTMSSRAAKAFLISNYIMQKSKTGKDNVFLLTATPFINNPIEIFNMLNLLGRENLKKYGINTMHDFLSHFIDLKNEWVVTTSGDIERRDVVKSFKDLPALQNIIKNNVDFCSTSEIGIELPEQKEYLIELPMTEEQEKLLHVEQMRLASDLAGQTGEMLKAITNMRQITLSPKALNYEKPHEISGVSKEQLHIIKSSPKLQFVVGCAAKIYKKKPNVGQVIYMPRGIEHYDDVVQSLVESGIPRDAIAYIHSSYPNIDEREEIIRRFNDPNDKLKIIIGSETIKEGIDLNGNTAVLYNTMLDWNPNGTVQLNGRVRRQGNRQKNVFIFYPALSDSIDSAIYQKHSEKMSRFGEVWNYKGDVLDVSDIDPEEIKYEIIRDPDKKAEIKIRAEQQKIMNEKRELELHRDNLNIIANNLNTKIEEVNKYENTIKEINERIENIKTKIANLQSSGDNSEQTRSYIDFYTKQIKTISDTLKYAKEEKEAREKAVAQFTQLMKEYNLTTIEEVKKEVENLNEKIRQYDTMIKDVEKKRADYMQQAIKEMEANKKKLDDIENITNKYAEMVISGIKERIEKAFRYLIINNTIIKAYIVS